MAEPDAPRYGQISLTSQPVNISVSVPESDEDARHRRRKYFIRFAASLTFVVILALVATWAVFAAAFVVILALVATWAAFAAADDKQREWGMGVLLLIVGGCVGYLTGKSAR